MGVLQSMVERQDMIIERSGVPASVAIAMDCWVLLMKGGEVTCGYPNKSGIFASGGITCFDDMDMNASIYAGRAVDGAVRSLSSMESACISVVWLGSAEDPGAFDRINDTAIRAMPSIYRILQMKGVA
jgi:hypothetical protein